MSRTEHRRQTMESSAFYISISEGVYSSWHAVGARENLQCDADIAHFLVALYLGQKQREGEESRVRCADCHCLLTLYCSTCHCPSPLTLPSQPPPPSLSSSPPPPPPTHALDASAPVLVTDDTDHSSHWQQHTAVSDIRTLQHAVITGVNIVECEENSGASQQDEEEREFDECPVDFSSVKQDSPSTIGDCEPTVIGTDFAACSARGTSRRNRKCHRDSSAKDSETSDPGKRKKGSGPGKRKKGSDPGKRKKGLAAMSITHARKSKRMKAMKKRWCMTSNTEGAEKARENVIQAEGLLPMAAQLCAHESQKEGRENSTSMTLENISQGQKKGTVNELENLTEGFVIPMEERCSALIHTFDNIFFKHPKIGDKTFRHTGRRQKVCTMSQKLLQKESSTPNSNARANDQIPGTQNNAELTNLDKTSRHFLRILVSGQKIPPLKTAKGSYSRTLYSHFECLYCKKAFIHKRIFNKHVQTHTQQSLYKCTLCDKRFESLYDLGEHEKKHKFECELCGKKCTEKTDYIQHMKLHTENSGVMKCPGCPYQSTDFYLFRKHKYECAYLRPALQCEICGVHLKSIKSLKHHIAAIHRNDRPYKCTMCDKSFVFKTKLTCHMKYNHAEGGRLFHCDKCGNRFIDPKGLKSHQKSVHSKEKPFKCSHCPSAFARKYTLGVHLRLHTGEKPYRCTECLQAFVQKPSLLLHLRSHHGQKVTKMNKQANVQHCS